MIRELILSNAESYPERPAVISANNTILYRDLWKILPENPGCDLVTSGTTDGPKKFSVPHDLVYRKVMNFGVRRGSAYAALKSVYGLSTGLSPVWTHSALYMFLKGGTIFILEGIFDPERDLDMCEMHGVEGFMFIPKLPLFWKFVELGHKYRFPYVFVSGGAATRDQLRTIRDAMGINLWVNYAAAEVGPISGGSLDQVGDIEGCVGFIVPGVEVEIDGDQIRIRCDTMAMGYDDDQILTANRFKNGWFYPGDLGHFEQGMLVIDGRV